MVQRKDEARHHQYLIHSPPLQAESNKFLSNKVQFSYKIIIKICLHPGEPGPFFMVHRNGWQVPGSIFPYIVRSIFFPKNYHFLFHSRTFVNAKKILTLFTSCSTIFFFKFRHIQISAKNLFRQCHQHQFNTFPSLNHTFNQFKIVPVIKGGGMFNKQFRVLFKSF